MSFLSKAGCHYSSHVSADLSPNTAVPTEWGAKYKNTQSYSPADQAVVWALLSQLLFRGQLEAGILMEGFALEFHFESGGRKLSLGKKTFNSSFLIYDEQSLSRFSLLFVFENLSPKLKIQEEGNYRRRGKLGEKSMFNCRFLKKTLLLSFSFQRFSVMCIWI